MLSLYSGHKLFFTFQTFIDHKVLEISGNGLHCSEATIEIFYVNCPANSDSAEMYTAGEHKMAVAPSKMQCLFLWFWEI
jgi:hypothetical protein